MTEPPEDLTALDPSHPTVRFTSTVGGFHRQLDDDRSVELIRGVDEDGKPTWALVTRNKGRKIGLCFSDDAMEEIVTMYHILTIKGETP